MKLAKKGVILYGILNWGLGHATRSVSVIRALEQQGFEVVIASDGEALRYLRKVFPENRLEELPGYNIKYGKHSQLLKLGLQLPKIWRVARREHQLLRKLVQKFDANGVISDNRLGWYHSDVPSVYLTHQLKLIMPVLSDQISKLHHLFIHKYDECWIPDWEDTENISGDFSHTVLPKIPVRYIGPQSRMGEEKSEPVQKKYDLAIILSGPEPQRSILEEKLLDQLRQERGKFLLIRGTDRQPPVLPAENLEVIDLADAQQVKQAILSSTMVISRSGYSSLMDYYFLGNRALLIPTPGQPEQEYLARYQLHKGRFGYASQEYLNLKEDLEKAAGYNGFQNNREKRTDWSALFRLFEGKGKG